MKPGGSDKQVTAPGSTGFRVWAVWGRWTQLSPGLTSGWLTVNPQEHQPVGERKGGRIKKPFTECCWDEKGTRERRLSETLGQNRLQRKIVLTKGAMEIQSLKDFLIKKSICLFLIYFIYFAVLRTEPRNFTLNYISNLWSIVLILRQSFSLLPRLSSHLWCSCLSLQECLNYREDL